jgi:glycosyltransferase involved in cell wall biosynthesis
VLVSVVIPVYVSEALLPLTLARVDAIRNDADLEVLLVVDVPRRELEHHARDANNPVAERYGAIPLYRFEERGFGSALRRGFAATHGDAVIPVMADNSDAPEDIPRLLGALEHGWDVVAASRYMRGGQIVGHSTKQWISRSYSLAIRALGGPSVADVSNAFKAYRRSVIDAVTTVSESFDISVEITVKAAAQGFTVTQVPTTWTNRAEGESRFDFARELSNYGRWLTYVAKARREGAAGAVPQERLTPT